MSIKVIPLNVFVYGTNVKVPIPCQIPIGISGKEIINLLKFKYNVEVEPDNILIAKLPVGNSVSYYIIDSKSDFAKCADNKDISILVYPPKICLTIHAPDGHSVPREFDSKKTVGDMIASLCHSSFRLQTHLAYAIYLKIKENYVPLNAVKTIIECNPFTTDIYLRRYFWLKPYVKTNRENDINFSYYQAVQITYNQNFPYKLYKFIDLIAIHLIIKYETYEKAKKILKKAKKKQVFPKYIYDSRKNIKNTVKQMKQYDGKPVLELKKTFISLCLSYQFFGIPQWKVQCSPPEKLDEPKKDYILTADEEFVYILEPKANIIVSKTELSRISKYNCSNNNILFSIVDKKRQEKTRSATKWNLSINSSLSFSQYFTNLVHFVKHENIQRQKKEDHKSHKHKRKRANTLSRSMSISTFKTSSFNFVDRDDMDMTDVDFHPTLELSSSNKILKPVIPPEQQKAVDSDIEFAGLTTFDTISDIPYLDLLKSYINKDDMQFGYSNVLTFDEINNNELPHPSKIKTAEEKVNIEDDEENEEDDILPPEVYLTDACALVKKTVNEDALISETIMFIQSYLPRSQFKQNIIGWQLQCQSDSSFQRISCVSRAIIYFIYLNRTIAPLDLFSTINYIHSILLVYGRSFWTQINFIEIAKSVDYQLGLVAENYLSLSKRVTHPIVSILLDCSLRTTTQYQDLLLLTQTIYFALYVTCITIAKAFCNAKIANNILQPILDTLPDVLVFDMGKLIELSEPLYQIGRAFEKNEEAQRKFFSQLHYSNPQLKSIMSIINDIHNTTILVQTPVYAFFSAFAQSLSFLPQNPTRTIIEAGDIFACAQHCSIVYWNIENCRLRCLSREISWNASNFYAMFVLASQDMSLVTACETYYNQMIECWKKFVEEVATDQNIYKFLDGLEPAHMVIKNLISSTEKFEATIGLLCLISATRKNRIKALDASYKSLDEKLAEDRLRMSDLNNVYRIFSILSLDFNKINPGQTEQLIELGNKLIEIVIPEEEEEQKEGENKGENENETDTTQKVDNPEGFDEDKESEERRLKIKYCRDLLKALYYVPEEPLMDLSVGADVLPPPVINSRPSPGEMQVQLTPHNPRNALDVLRRLADVLAKFTYDPINS